MLITFSLTCIYEIVQNNVMVEEVKLRRKYLNSGDVFILDLGLDLVQVGYSNVWMSIMRQSDGTCGPLPLQGQ